MRVCILKEVLSAVIKQQVFFSSLSRNLFVKDALKCSLLRIQLSWLKLSNKQSATLNDLYFLALYRILEK